MPKSLHLPIKIISALYHQLASGACQNLPYLYSFCDVGNMSRSCLRKW